MVGHCLSVEVPSSAPEQFSLLPTASHLFLGKFSGPFAYYLFIKFVLGEKYLLNKNFTTKSKIFHPLSLIINKFKNYKSVNLYF